MYIYIYIYIGLPLVPVRRQADAGAARRLLALFMSCYITVYCIILHHSIASYSIWLFVCAYVVCVVFCAS